MQQRFVTPDGEEFFVEVEATNRILNEGIPFIIVDIKEERLPIKEGEHFLFTNLEGDIPSDNTSGLGFYYLDTRFLSCYEFTLNGRRPILLSSTAERDYMSRIEMTNGDIQTGDKLTIPQETVNVRRLRLIKDGLYERMRIKNYNPVPVKVEVGLSFNADFADLFEVRGMRRKSRGKLMVPKVDGKRLVFGYMGEDGAFMQTRVYLPRQPDAIETAFNKTTVLFRETIAAGKRIVLNLFIEPVISGNGASNRDFNSAIAELSDSYSEWREASADIYTDNELFNSVIGRGISDIRALLTKTPEGEIFHAGIPWYVAPFGRDSLITALEILSLSTRPARGVLEFLTAYQGREVNLWRDEEPGKILHELRRGELARTKEIPHTPYYGSVDSTPLYLMLASEYYRWTGDAEFIESIWPNLIAALDWIDKFGDKDGDGFLEYLRRSERGLINQGWKDSWNAVAHADGRLAEPPIALCEVQGYVYAAKIGMAEVAQDLGKKELADRLLSEASELKERFNEVFWMPKERFYAMALDGHKRHVETISSNPGHCLWTKIVAEEMAERAMDRLLKSDMFSGWGVRTISKMAKSYNPMSYHNGSVWPHDNAILIAGAKRYGFSDAVIALSSALFDAAIHHTYYRLPELFCGFTRRGTSWPIKYSVACSPQAWSVGAVFLLLQAILGMRPDRGARALRLVEPILPPWLNWVTIKNLRIGDSVVGLRFFKENGLTKVEELYREGEISLEY